MMQMFRAKCICGWVYDTVVLPMPITVAARAIDATCCPMCGNRKGNTCAAPRDLTSDEREFKIKVMRGSA